MATFSKDPDALLDYKVDWGSWLGTTDTIASAVVSSPGFFEVDGIRLATHAVSGNNGHVIWLSAGSTNEEYQITSRIWTSAGRRNDQTFIVRIQPR